MIYVYFQNKNNHIKQIPAFKPIPTENATPDSTPEKSTDGAEAKNVKVRSFEDTFVLNEPGQVCPWSLCHSRSFWVDIGAWTKT